jgi:hypothetical protein
MPESSLFVDSVTAVVGVEDVELESSIDAAVHALLTMDVSPTFLNPELSTFFRERDTYDGVSASSPLSFPPTLGDVLASPEPPSVEFFRSLPRPTSDDKLWAIYAVLMEHDDLPCVLYIGSGTDATGGVFARIKMYTPNYSTLPELVEAAFRKGYRVSSIGMLCWTPLPSAGVVPAVRARFLGLEEYFAIRLHAIIKMRTDYLFQDLVSWPRESVSWAPLCTHHPLREALRGDLSLSPEQLEVIAAARVKRAHELALLRSQRHRASRRAADPEAFMKKQREDKLEWTHKNRDRVNETAAGTKERAISAQRFRCATCDLSLQSQAALDKHLLSQAHKDRSAGIIKPPPSKRAVATAAVRKQSKASKKHHCAACDKSFDTDWALTRHNNTPRHQKKLSLLKSPL